MALVAPGVGGERLGEEADRARKGLMQPGGETYRGGTWSQYTIEVHGSRLIGLTRSRE